MLELSDEKIGAKKLCRGKILDRDKYIELLMVANRLKSIKGFKNVYIQQDLTFRKRQEQTNKSQRENMSQAVKKGKL